MLEEREEIEIFPSNFEETLQSLNISLTQENRVELLRYGQTVIENQGLDYNFLLENCNPLLINKQMYHEYLSSKENEIYYKIIEYNLLPELKMVLSSSKTFLSVWSFFDKRDLVQETSNNISNSLELVNQNKYTEAMQSLGSIDKEREKIFSMAILITKNKERYENILKTNSLFPTNLIEKSSQEDTSENKPKEIYIEDTEQIRDQFLETIRTKTNDLPNNHPLKKQFSLLEEQLEEIDIDDIYNTLYNKHTGDDHEAKILLKVIEKEEKKILTISPYILTNQKEKLVNNENFSETYDTTPVSQPNGSVRIPVLMYHQIAKAPKGSSKFVQGLYVSPEIFEQQIAYITRKNYKTISSKEFSDIIATGKNPSQKTVMLTFDDSHPTHYAQAYPILKKYGQTGVFFIPSSRSAITSNQLEEMALNGMSIDSHSATHLNLSTMTDEKQLLIEIAGSKSALQARTNKPVYSIAYPGCVGSEKAYQLVASSGYLLGFSCGRKIDHYPSNKYSISRVHVFNDMESFIDLLSGKN